MHGSWPADIGPDLDAARLEEFLDLWGIVSMVELRPDTEDVVIWTWDSVGVCLALRGPAA